MIILPTITPILVLGAIAFYTLLERNYLAYSQLRNGPNNVGTIGVPQPLADACNLFANQNSLPTIANTGLFLLAPIINLWLALFLWTLMPLPTPTYYNFGILIFLAISSLSVYTVIGSGWTANSNYSLLGALRAIAQTISYEVSIVLTLLSFLLLPSTFNLINLQSPFNIALIIWPLTSIWFATALAETNRAPFDLAEGESELVSGFNTEYSGSIFAFIFIAEYINILFLSILSALLLLQTSYIPYINLTINTSILSTLFLATRTSFPRIRYDNLINMTWTSFLPISLFVLLAILSQC